MDQPIMRQVSSSGWQVSSRRPRAWRIKSRLLQPRKQTLMTLDGMVMVTDRDNFVYHEMMSHPALFTNPDPKRVLVIGGGDCGTLHEVLKHASVELAEQVELDERVTRVAEKFFPELCESNGDQ